MNVNVEPATGVTLTLTMTGEEAADLKGLLFRADWNAFPFAEQIVDELAGYAETDTTVEGGEVTRA